MPDTSFSRFVSQTHPRTLWISIRCILIAVPTGWLRSQRLRGTFIYPIFIQSVKIMKIKIWLTTGLLAASFFIGGNAWADKTSSNSSDGTREPAANRGMPNCTTEERMKEVAEENTFAQDRLGEVKDVGANVLGAALSIFTGVDIPIGETRDAYDQAQRAKRSYEIFTPCTPEQEMEIKRIKEQAAAQAHGGEDKTLTDMNPTVTTPPQTEESLSEKTGKFIRALPSF